MIQTANKILVICSTMPSPTHGRSISPDIYQVSDPMLDTIHASKIFQANHAGHLENFPEHTASVILNWIVGDYCEVNHPHITPDTHRGRYTGDGKTAQYLTCGHECGQPVDLGLGTSCSVLESRLPHQKEHICLYLYCPYAMSPIRSFENRARL
jgi:hypothetical protein